MVDLVAFPELVACIAAKCDGVVGKEWQQIATIACAFDSAKNDPSQAILTFLYIANHSMDGPKGETTLLWSQITAYLCSLHARSWSLTTSCTGGTCSLFAILNHSELSLWH
jgi:hypothetical protein